MMWLKRSTSMNWVTSTEPATQTLERSLRDRSTSIRCSARSFSSASSSSARALSASTVLPRGREPAMGWVMTSSPVTVTSASGEEPTIEYCRPSASSRLKMYMYGLGLVFRSTR